jgi:hypothetical protein
MNELPGAAAVPSQRFWRVMLVALLVLTAKRAARMSRA